MHRPTELPCLAGVILAAGASRRMGKNKMLLALEGESLIRRAAKRALGAGLSPVVVVIGHEAERLRAELRDLPVEFAVNPAYTGPTSGSLHQGLNVLSADVDAVVVMLGDMVRVSAETLAMLVAAARSIASVSARSEEHTSELQSPCNLVCRLLLEKKK